MSLPHEYYGHDKRPHLHERHNDALYADPDYLANEHDDVLPLHSTIGLGPQGRGSIPIVKEYDDEKGTFAINFIDDNTGETLLETPNLHAGYIYDDSEETNNELVLKIKRNGVPKTLTRLTLPQGETGSRIYTVSHNKILPLSKDNTYVLDKNDLLYNSEQYEEMPEPRVWDICFANIEAYAPDVSPKVKRRYFGSGTIVAVFKKDVIILFKTIYRDSQLDDKEDKLNKVTHVDEQSTDIQYPSAKCVYTIQERLNGLIDEEKHRAEQSEENLQQQIINDVTRVIVCDELPPISEANPNYIYSIPKSPGDESFRNSRYEFYKVGNEWEQIGKDLPKHGLEIHLPSGEILWYDESDGKTYMLLDWESGEEKELLLESTKEDSFITRDSFIISATEGFKARLVD